MQVQDLSRVCSKRCNLLDTKHFERPIGHASFPSLMNCSVSFSTNYSLLHETSPSFRRLKYYLFNARKISNPYHQVNPTYLCTWIKKHCYVVYKTLVIKIAKTLNLKIETHLREELNEELNREDSGSLEKPLFI